MSDLMLPPTLAVLLAAFTPCFQARSVVVFQWLILGWMQCQGRRTLTEVALASGAVGGAPHFSVPPLFQPRLLDAGCARARGVHAGAAVAARRPAAGGAGRRYPGAQGWQEYRPGQHAPRPAVE